MGRDSTSQEPYTLAIAHGVEAALQVLVGKPMARAGRAASLAWFQFGEIRTHVTKRSPKAKAGEYALHAECLWRLLGPDGVITAMSDVHYTAGPEPEYDYDGDKTNAIGSSRFDERIRRIRPLEKARALVVERVTVDAGFGLSVELARGYRIEVAPADTTDEEQWRFFRPWSDDHHLVVSACGMEVGGE